MGSAAPSSWVWPGAKFDFDFANNRYFSGAIGFSYNTAPGYQGCVIAGSDDEVAGFAPNHAGILVPFQASSPRITDLGLFVDPGTTNHCLYSRTLTNAVWTAANVTVAKNQTGADGTANGAHTVTATANGGTLSQAITMTSKSVNSSFWIKRLSGSGSVTLSQDGGATTTDVTASLNTTGFVQVKCAAYQTLTNPAMILTLATSGDSLAVDFASCDSDDGAIGLTSYVPFPMVTTNATVTRYSETNAINDVSGVHPNDGYRLFYTSVCARNPWASLVTFCTGGPGTTRGCGIIVGDVSLGSSMTVGGTVTGQGATAPGTGNIGLGAMNKLATSTNGSGTVCCLNGGAISSVFTGANAFPQQTMPSTTHCVLGNNGSAQNPLCGYISRLTFFDKELTQGQMMEWTR